jgi:hypothetical protein
VTSGKDSLKVELLYFDGCPSYQTAAKLLRAVMDDEGLTAGIDLIKVADEAAARRLKFVGSPSIRINGVDPFLHGEADYGMGCRVYAAPEGLKGWPTKQMLREALTRKA